MKKDGNLLFSSFSLAWTDSVLVQILPVEPRKESVRNNVLTLWSIITCSIMSELSHLCRASFHRSPSLLYRWQFSQSNCFSSWCRVWGGLIKAWLTDYAGLILTLLLRHTTGHMEQPRVQQQQRQPNNNQRTLTGRAFLRVTLTRVTVAWRS